MKLLSYSEFKAISEELNNLSNCPTGQENREWYITVRKLLKTLQSDIEARMQLQLAHEED